MIICQNNHFGKSFPRFTDFKCKKKIIKIFIYFLNIFHLKIIENFNVLSKVDLLNILY